MFLLLFGVLLAIVGVFSYRSGSQSLKDAAISEMEAVAIEKESALDRWIDERLDDLQQIPSDLTEKAGLLIAAPPSSKEARAAHERLMEELTPHMGGPSPGFVELFVMDPQSGKVVASTNRSAEGKSKLGHPYFENGTTAPYVQGPYLAGDPEMLGITATIPLRAPDGRLVAVMAARLDLGAMTVLVQRRTGLRQTDDSFLLNEQRVLVTRPRFLAEQAGPGQQQIDGGAVRRCVAHSDGVILERDYRGVPVIAVYRWIDKRQLGLIVKIDQDEALAPARAFGRSVMLVSSLALLATMALAFFLARTIRQRAAELAEGNRALHAENIRRKRAQEESRQSEERFRELADNITDVFWIMSLDMNEMHFISKAYEAVWRFSRQSLYADPHQWSDAIVPEDRERALARFIELTGDVPSIDLEYRIRCPDGTVRWIHNRGFQIRNTAGCPIRTAGVATDITELKQAAESLKKSEAHKSSIVESALDCIITVDAQGVITEFNPSAEETFGHERAVVLGKQFADVIVPHQWRADHLQRMAAYHAAGEAEAHTLGKRIEGWALRADGTEFPVELGMSGARIQGERSITVFIRDITERKRAELRVEALHKELLDASRRAGMAEVATGVLHNVGNVLNSINVSTTLIIERLQTSRVARLNEVAKLLGEHTQDLSEFLTLDERGRKLPEFLAQLAAHLNRETQEVAEEMQAVAGNIDHIKEIVSTQQSYAGSFGVLEPLDLRDSIEDALRIHFAALNRHDIEIVRKLEPIAPVVVDKHKVLQILVNLISNAKYAMANSPVKTLTIKAYPSSDGSIQVSIQDTGCGIVAENITRIFVHGFTTKKDGHGFGLHSSALAAKEMKALLIASSDGVGQGAVFTLVFPPAVAGQRAA